jgi:7,8-dihydroneopterin aldolase/epimerase/oxygenase
LSAAARVAAAADSMDIVFIRDLRLDTRIGAYETERRKVQTLQFELELGREQLQACTTDRLTDTMDYAEVVGVIQAVLAEHEFHLLEPLAEAIARRLLDRFDARWIKLEVSKVGVVPGARQVGVRIERRG